MLRRNGSAIVPQVSADLSVQFLDHILALGRFLGVLDLFHLQFQRLNFRLAVQRCLIGINGGNGSAAADPFALFPPDLQQTAALLRKKELFPHHKTGEMLALLHPVVVGKGCCKGVAEIAHRLNAEIGNQRQRQRRHQCFCAERVVFHRYLCLCIPHSPEPGRVPFKVSPLSIPHSGWAQSWR